MKQIKEGLLVCVRIVYQLNNYSQKFQKKFRLKQFNRLNNNKLLIINAKLLLNILKTNKFKQLFNKPNQSKRNKKDWIMCQT